MGLRARGAALSVLLLAVAAPSRPARAGGFYRYVDAQGVIHFTDAPPDARYQRVRISPLDGRVHPWPQTPPHDSHAYDSLIARAARRQGLPPALVKAVVAAESDFNPRAVSRKGALGLMQLMPTTAERLGVADPFRVEENLAAGARYLRRLLDRYGNLTRALAAYNAGPDAVDRSGGIPPFRETQQYVRQVLHYYHGYHGDFFP